MISKNTRLQDVLKLAPPCKCHACSHPCTMGSGFLAHSDLTPIAKFLGLTEKELKENHLEEVEMFNKTFFRPKLHRKDGKPYGKCTFYDNLKGCTIHPVKPLQCKTSMGCSPYGDHLSAWFVLNHLVDTDDPEAVRQYAQYLKNGGTKISGGELHEIVEDKEKLRKMLSYEHLL